MMISFAWNGSSKRKRHAKPDDNYKFYSAPQSHIESHLRGKEIRIIRNRLRMRTGNGHPPKLIRINN